MSKPEDIAKGRDTVRYEQLASQVGYIQKIVILVMVASLAISVCVNLYVVPENMAIKGTLRTYEKKMETQAGVYQVTQRLVMDLRALSRNDKAVVDLLKKYGITDSPFMLAAPETPPPPATE